MSCFHGTFDRLEHLLDECQYTTDTASNGKSPKHEPRGGIPFVVPEIAPNAWPWERGLKLYMTMSILCLVARSGLDTNENISSD